MNEYKVSIIVGVYNSAKFLRKGLDSIVNQTWTNIEVLLMDDGSTDESGQICDEYANKDKRFIAVHKKNSGVCDSRNKGLELATGDYVCFMDGDDWLCVDFVEYMMSLIISTNTKMALSDKIFTSYDQIQSVNKDIEIWNSEKTISLIIYPYMALGPWNKIYSMEIIRKYKIKFPERWFGETLHFATMVALYAEHIGVGHRKVYNYRLDNLNSGTTQYNVEGRLISIENCKKLRTMPFYNTSTIINAVEWHIFNNHYLLIENIIGSKDKRKYLTEYKTSRRYLWKNGLRVFFHSDVTFKQKIKILIQMFVPNIFAKTEIRKRENLRK